MKILTIIFSDNTADHKIGSQQQINQYLCDYVKEGWKEEFGENFPHDEIEDEDVSEYMSASGLDYYINDLAPSIHQLITLDGEKNGLWMSYEENASELIEQAKNAINERYDYDMDNEPHIIIEQEMEDKGFIRVYPQEVNVNINW